jgi:hypothetical protein
MGKTLFRNQLQLIGSTETLHCPTCMRENNTEITEDLIHPTFSCPTSTQSLMKLLTHSFPTYNQTSHTGILFYQSSVTFIHFMRANLGKHLQV